MAFLLSGLSSLLAGVILLLVMSVMSPRFRWVLTGLLARMLTIDIDFVFPNKVAAQKDIEEELKRAKEVVIFAGRGNELQSETFAPILRGRHDGSKRPVRILLPRTELSHQDEYDWTAQREGELAKFDSAFGSGLLRKQIEITVAFFQSYIADGTVDLRRFCCPHIGRILVTDRFAYFTPYRDDAHPRESCVYKFRRDGNMYDNLSRLFEQLWHSCPATASVARTTDGGKM